VAVAVDHRVLQPGVYLCRSMFHGHRSSLEQPAEKDPYASLRSIASREFVFVWRVRARADSTVTIYGHDHGLCAPRLWIFLSSLQEALFSVTRLGLLNASFHRRSSYR
jgi:hypothetical protein